MSGDLIVLTADVQQEKTLETLLRERHGSLGIRQVSFSIFRHPRKDSGVCREAHSFLRPYQASYSYALVILDGEWSGAPGDGTVLRAQIGERLAQSGWPAERCEVIVAEPELESWVWADSPVVAEELRLEWAAIRAPADELTAWPAGAAKPARPKELLEAVLRRQGRPRSAALFQAIARRVGLARCVDPSFALLRETLGRWFGDAPRPPQGQPGLWDVEL